MTDVSLVTGASAGLGAIFAKRLAAEKRNLLLVARRADKLEALAKELTTQHGVKVFVEAADLSKPGAVAELMQRVSKQSLNVTCLINNAGFGLNGDFAELDGTKQAEMVNLNCTALTELCHAVLPGMIAKKSGEILNVASTAAFQAGPRMAVYYATKAFVLSFSEAIHEEVKRHGVKVSCLCPGPTETEFFAAADMGKTNLTKLAGSADKVVDDGLRALRRNQAFTVSGLMNKLLAQSGRFSPRAITRKIAMRLQA